MTFTIVPKHLAVDCHYLFVQFGAVATGDRTPISLVRGESSTNRGDKTEKHNTLHGKGKLKV